MVYVMLDTCIWISFLERADLRSPLAALDRLVSSGDVTLLITEEIRDEFQRDRTKKVRMSRTEKKVLAEFAKRVKGDADAGVELKAAADLLLEYSKGYERPELITEALNYVEDLHQRSIVVPDSDGVQRRVVDRVKRRRAPFHDHGKAIQLSMNDALIIEKFADQAINGLEGHYVFVSTNRKEYAMPANANEPHENFSDIFGERCHFTKHVDLLIHILEDRTAHDGKARLSGPLCRQSWADVCDQLRVASDRDWYHGHLILRQRLAEGSRKLGSGRTVIQPLRPVTIGEESWREDLAKAAEMRARDRSLTETSDPRDAGFAAGATSALRWVLGRGQAPFGSSILSPID